MSVTRFDKEKQIVAVKGNSIEFTRWRSLASQNICMKIDEVVWRRKEFLQLENEFDMIDDHVSVCKSSQYKIQENFVGKKAYWKVVPTCVILGTVERKASLRYLLDQFAKLKNSFADIKAHFEPL